MREWTKEERERAEEQIRERCGNHWPVSKPVSDLQCQVNVLREALEEFLEGVDPDCGDPDCYDCKAYRTARQALLDTAPDTEDTHV